MEAIVLCLYLNLEGLSKGSLQVIMSHSILLCDNVVLSSDDFLLRPYVFQVIFFMSKSRKKFEEESIPHEQVKQ